jgi:asparagine synthase (glutamine-hydrolysing)
MSGICGIVYKDAARAVNGDLIENMVLRLKHRGLDKSECFLDLNVGLGLVSTKHELIDEIDENIKTALDGRYRIVFDGRILNSKELRREMQDLGISFHSSSDAEVVLNAYINWGESCLHRFIGSWAFVVYDCNEKRLFGARDRYGVKPLYYHEGKDHFVFASEISVLFALPQLRNDIEHQSVFDFLVFNRTDQSVGTFYEGVLRLQHGHSFSITAGEVSISQWYDLRNKIGRPLEKPAEFLDVFTESIELNTQGDKLLGLSLSGGLDSSAIASVMIKKLGLTEFHTFSAVYGKHEIGDESEYINLYRPHLNNMHFLTPSAESLLDDYKHFIRTLGEPVPSTSPYAQYKVMQCAKDFVQVTIDGQGSDEQLAGYPYLFGFYFKELASKGRLLKLISEMLCYYHNHHELVGIKSFLYFLLPAALKTSLRTKRFDYLNSDFNAKYSGSNRIADTIYEASSLQDALIRHFEYKIEHLLKWGDRNSTCFSIESRMPFMDHRLVERSLATKSDLLISNGMTKSILRKALKGILPDEIRERKSKYGFETPQDKWFRDPRWTAVINDVLNDPLLEDYVDLNKCRVLYQEHLSGKLNIAKEVWKWINLSVWIRQNRESI